LPAPGRPVIPILSASPMPPTRRQKYALRYKRVFISVASGGELDSWRTKVIHFPTNGGWGLGWGGITWFWYRFARCGATLVPLAGIYTSQ